MESITKEKLKNYFDQKNTDALKKICKEYPDALKLCWNENRKEINALTKSIHLKMKDVILEILETDVGKQLCQNMHTDKPAMVSFIDKYRRKEFDEEIFLKLIDNTNVNAHFGSCQWTFLMYSIHLGNSVVFDYLLNNMNLEAPDNKKNTAVHYAAEQCDNHYLYWLCTKNVNLNVRNENGNTPDTMEKCIGSKKKLIENLKSTSDIKERKEILRKFKEDEKIKITPGCNFLVMGCANVYLEANINGAVPKSPEKEAVSGRIVTSDSANDDFRNNSQKYGAVPKDSSEIRRDRKTPSQSDDLGREVEVVEMSRPLPELILPRKVMADIMRLQR